MLYSRIKPLATYMDISQTFGYFIGIVVQGFECIIETSSAMHPAIGFFSGMACDQALARKKSNGLNSGPLRSDTMLTVHKQKS